MKLTDSGQRREELSADVQARIYRTLGQGVVQAWSGLPQKIQEELFEAAVNAVGEQMRDTIAIFLHGHHYRTKSGLQERAMPEPDSRGGKENIPGL
jgi:hypothetical protein